jgi:hypothetical protein
MPAAPVATRTPAISGMSGKFEGASGDTATGMVVSPIVEGMGSAATGFALRPCLILGVTLPTAKFPEKQGKYQGI